MGSMYFLYFDESGCTSKFTATSSPLSPALVISGLIIKASSLPTITIRFMDLKKQYFRKKQSAEVKEYNSNWIRHEIKGNEIRKIIATENRNNRRPIEYFLKDVIALLDEHNCKLISRVFVKGINAEFRGTAVYSSAIQSFYGIFQHFLNDKNSNGVIIGDSRDAHQNSQVSHSVFSKKMSASGDDFNRILEMPMFAHSENSAGLQLADLIASGLIWPITMESFCKPHIKNNHIRDYARLKEIFCQPVSKLQYRYTDKMNYRQGGIIISNKLNSLPAKCFFKNEKDLCKIYEKITLKQH